LLATIKAWIKNFDIKPQPPMLALMLEQAQEFIAHGEILSAIVLLKNILYLSATNATALKLLSLAYLEASNYPAGLRIVKCALHYYPTEMLLWRYQGMLLAASGKAPLSIHSFTQACSLAPDSATNRHLLKAASNDGRQNTELAYIEGLFDYYAAQFDTSLGKLRYHAPAYLIATVAQQVGTHFNTIVDLGCGTGLVGQQIAATLSFNNLIGVDIANQMLVMAQAKNIYNHLYHNDILTYLQTTALADILTSTNNPANDPKANLIVCCDVLMYIGELSALFAAISQLVINTSNQQARNLFIAFSTEANNNNADNYFLNINGRFAHHGNYILHMLTSQQLKLIYQEPITIRYERNQPVHGNIYVICGQNT
jgi:predicted TPR repeat methyltransferase